MFNRSLPTIIVGRNGKATVRKIIDAMESDVNLVEVFHRRNGTKFARVNGERTLRRNHPDVGSIAWGYPNSIRTTGINNSGEQVRTYSNKARARMRISSIARTPETVLAGSYTGPEGDWICRPNFHQAGSGTTVVGANTLITDGYASKIIKKKREFRIHVANGKVLACQEKVPREEERRDDLVWNHHNGGFTFEILKWKRWPIKACIEAIKAVHALGYTWGAVDVAYDMDKVPYVFEVNSSPALNEYMTSKYAKYFDAIINGLRYYSLEESINATGYGGVILKEINYASGDTNSVYNGREEEDSEES